MFLLSFLILVIRGFFLFSWSVQLKFVNFVDLFKDLGFDFLDFFLSISFVSTPVFILLSLGLVYSYFTIVLREKLGYGFEIIVLLKIQA